MPTPPPARVTLADCPVPYKILYSHPATLKGQFGQGWSVTTDFLVAERDKFAFCQFAAGTSKPVDMGGGVTANRIIPLSHPDAFQLLCTGIDCNSTGHYTPTNTPISQNWSDAKVGLTFTSVPFLTDGSTPFYQIEARGAAEQYSIPGTGYYFPSDNKPIKQDASIGVATTTYVLTFFQVPTINQTGFINAALNPINSTTFLNFTAGYIRFDTWDIRLTMSSNFQPSYVVTVYVTWRARPWIEFLRTDGIWEAAKKTIDNTYAYGSSDLNALLN